MCVCKLGSEAVWRGFHIVGMGDRWLTHEARGPALIAQAPCYTPGSGRGAIAQLGERLNGIQKVRGSNPLSSTKDLAPMASRSSASELGERVATRLGGCPLNPLPESAGGDLLIGQEK